MAANVNVAAAGVPPVDPAAAGVGVGAAAVAAPPQPVVYTVARAMEACGFRVAHNATHPHGEHQFVAECLDE